MPTSIVPQGSIAARARFAIEQLGYGVLGRLIAQAQLSYEEAEMNRKVGHAEAIVVAKTSPDVEVHLV